MESSQFRESILEQLASIGKALSDPSRLLLLDLLTQGKRTVNELAETSGLSVANTSQHLQTLHGAGLIERSKKGLNVHYRTAGDDVVEFYRQFQRLGENHSAEMQQVIDQFFGEKESLEQVNLDELMDRLKTGDITLLDVRPREEYEEGHLQEAISVPLEELEDQLDKIPDDQEIVAYCRGRFCVLSVEAVEILQEHGYEAVRLQEGIQDAKNKNFNHDQLLTTSISEGKND